MIYQFINGLDPAHWATLGVVLIAADLFLLSSFHIAFVGLMAFGVAAIDALGAPPQAQAWSMVLGTPVLVGVGMRLIDRQPEAEPIKPQQALIGQPCKVIAVNPDDPRKGIGYVADHGEWPIEAPLEPLELQSPLVVIAVHGNSLEVEPLHQ